MCRQIIIWDDKPLRVARIHERLVIAMQKLKIKASISVQCEPPLIARQNLNGKIPALEIAGKYWRKGPGEEPDQGDITKLLQNLFVE